MSPLAVCAITQAAAPEPSGPGFVNVMVPMLLLFGIFYFMAIRPQHRREKERQAMIQNIKTGDRIVFAGGLLGTVVNVKEQTFVVKVADNVKMEIVRGAVSKVLSKGEKPEEEANSRKEK